METIEIRSLAELPQAAHRVREWLAEHNGVVAFYGAMGAGKTTLIREIATQMGVADAVTSPTFALINKYITGAGRPIYHFDFYRIDRIEEAFDLGYEEYFYGGALCLVEWPEKIENLLPDNTLRIRIDTDPTAEQARKITIE
ncbi:MAG: tRNA (adenosine(37)-N6)-threonylcarbamoyltransferase complex ATPase subunit type 1 TsaE [Rikenellaceae bacterium]|nr:tRNA (adenosine(37)-N6)-threonylcarbamoyltransferase complex ATPase subunit type 1 TsaE [Rikenellaceae bacterium]MCL2693288.1 tRNA (adenosine(37)-N6)-threonylcarbamoyltransferase complex ATPase subunit type 1 TsaE [Rikenellaceae bacterium]